MKQLSTYRGAGKACSCVPHASHPPGLVTAEVADNLQDFCETALPFKFNDVVLLSLTRPLVHKQVELS